MKEATATTKNGNGAGQTGPPPDSGGRFDPGISDFGEAPMAVPADSLAILNRTEIDIQISTARRYPRSIQQALALATTMATLDHPTAASCFYKLKRTDKDGKIVFIEGPSVRLAEIFSSAWGNMRFGARVIAEEEKWVVAQGIAHDLQTNNSTSVEIRRRITTRNGKRFSDDMVGVTANAACSIAARNAIFKVIPRCYVNQVYEAAKKTAIGDAKTFVQRRQDLLSYFRDKVGVGVERILPVLNRQHENDIDLNDLENLYGLATAIRDGETSIDEAFPPVDQGKPGDKPTEGEGEKDKAGALADQLAAKKATDTASTQTANTPAAATEPLTWKTFESAVTEAVKDVVDVEVFDRAMGLFLTAHGWKGKEKKADAKVLAETLEAIKAGRFDWEKGQVKS